MDTRLAEWKCGLFSGQRPCCIAWTIYVWKPLLERARTDARWARVAKAYIKLAGGAGTQVVCPRCYFNPRHGTPRSCERHSLCKESAWVQVLFERIWFG